MEKFFFSFLICLLSTSLIYFIVKKISLFSYIPNQGHKENFKNNIYIIGGLVIFVNFIIFFFLKLINSDYAFLTFFCLLFLIGIGSDIFNLSAKFRLFFIFFISYFLLSSVDVYVWDFQFNLLNDFIKSHYWVGILFSAICLATYVNGMNFIDGIHGLVIIYNLLTILFINIFLIYIIKIDFFILSAINLIIPVLIILLYLNLIEKVFLGDSGSYLIASIVAYFVLLLSQDKITSHPYVYANLLIYPAFEVFFSIFRKIYYKKNPLHPDRRHLHHILENILKKRYMYNSIKSKIYTSLIINCVIIIFFIVTLLFYNLKWLLILNIFIFCFIYTLAYLKLIKFKL